MAFEDRIRLPALSLIHRRPRLLKILTRFIEEQHRLISVYAPGGYGKSILLADFAQTTDLPVCWCSLEPIDRDPTSFLTLLAYSITDRFHEIEPDSLLQLVARGDTSNSIKRIAELMAQVGPHVIIIDDYHKAVSAGLTLAINALLQQLPLESTLIVAARGDLTLETDQIIDLLVTERATGLSEEELRFTPEEVQLVMRKRFGRRISLEDAAGLGAATDGNIAQILLTGHVMHAEQMVDRLTQSLGDDHDIIYKYLADEVFARQADEIQRFLLSTAVLPDMTAELCNALLNIDNAQELLEELVRKDLFITQIGAGFRYHDLFSEFLRAKLAQDQPAFRQVTVKAANLLRDRARFEDAVYLYLGVNAWDEASDLLEEQGNNFYNSGRALTLNTWLSQIPAEELARRPRLLLLQGTIFINDLSNPRQARTVFERAENEFQIRRNSDGVAEAQVLRSAVLRMSGKPAEALALAGQGLNQLVAHQAAPHKIAYAMHQSALANLMAGHSDTAVANLRQALDYFDDLNDAYKVAQCHHDLAVCLEKQGNINAAHYHFRQALKTWESLGNANDLANTLNSLGVSLYTVGQYDEALEHFKNGLDIALQIGTLRRAAFIWAGIGDVRLAQRRFDDARHCYQESTELAQSINARSLEMYNQVKVAETYFGQNDLAQALNLATYIREITNETGLLFEYALATALYGKILTRRAEYAAAGQAFGEATKIFAGTEALEVIKARLWLGYSLFLNARASAAYDQLRQAISQALDLGDLIRGLGPTIAEVLPLLYHFLHRPDIPSEVQSNIQLLLAQPGVNTAPFCAQIEVFAFGSPYLVVSDRRRQFSQRGGDQRMPEFLLYLLLEGQERGCRWDEVSTALWPDLDKNRASTRFHQTLRRLRSRLLDDQDIILVHDDYYQVNPDVLRWCDALAFDRLFQQVLEAPLGGSLDIQLELINLYQGEFLAGFELDEWGYTRRTRYENRFLQATNLAAEQLLKEKLPQQALAIVDKGLACNYFSEDLHRSAFKACAMLNLFDLLTERYTTLRQTFQTEFGAPPDPATVQLYNQLKQHR